MISKYKSLYLSNPLLYSSQIPFPLRLNHKYDAKMIYQPVSIINLYHKIGYNPIKKFFLIHKIFTTIF